MSLILDALKRAERERRLEKAPDLTAVYEEDHLSRRGGKPWVWLSGVFLIGAIIVAVILWPDRPPTRRSAAPTEPSAARSTPSKATGREKKVSSPTSSKSSIPRRAKDPSVQASVPRTPPPAVEGSPPATAAPPKPAAAAPVETAPLRPVSPASALKTSRAGAGKAAAESSPKGPPQPAADVSAPPAAAGSSTEETQDASTPTALVPARKTSPLPAPAPTAGKAAPLNPPVPSAPTEAAPSPPPPAEPARQTDSGKKTSIPLLSELPYEVKEKLGNLQINVHSYTEDPKERLIFINMKSYRVGDHIGENGPVLKEITPEGAVIDYGDGMVRLQVGR